VDADSRRWAALAVLCLSLLVVSIDNGILNVALPTLVRTLGATPSQLQWLVDAYTLVFAGLLLTAGNLGDRFGRRGVLTVGLVIFGASSLGASLARTPGQLIAWRAVMGVGAALIMPATLSILVNVFTEDRQRRRAIAYWSLMNATGAFIGPLAGGLLLRRFWWGSCFLVNVPVVVVALVLQRGLVPTSRNPAAARFDVVGAALSILALSALLWSIIEGPGRGWGSPAVAGGFLGFGVLAVAFVAWERRVSDPMIDIATFRVPQLTAAAAAMTIAFIAMTSSMFLIVQSLQLVKGYSPLVAALATSGPITTVNFLLMPRAPRLTERFGARWMIAAGAGLTGLAALVIAATTVHSGYANLFIGFTLMAAAFSVFVPASTEAIMTAVPKEMSGGASAINQTTRQLGQALGVAVGGSIAASGYRSGFSGTGLHLSHGALHAAGSSITGAITTARSLTGGARQQLLEVARVAFLHGVRLALVAAALLAVGGAAFAAFAIPSRHVPAAGAGRTAAAPRRGTMRPSARVAAGAGRNPAESDGDEPMTQGDSWSPDEPLDSETFEQGDDALEEGTRLDRGLSEDVGLDPSLDPTLQVDELELEELGATLEDPEKLVTLEGGIDDPDGLGSPPAGRHARPGEEGWDLDTPLVKGGGPDAEPAD
jgi:EmrB/QacA subfamily drug resistance transporter